MIVESDEAIPVAHVAVEATIGRCHLLDVVTQMPFSYDVGAVAKILQILR